MTDNDPATKADVAALKSDMQAMEGSLRSDIQDVESRLHTKIDTVESRLDDRFDKLVQHITEDNQRTRDHFDAAVEKIHEDLAGANADEISNLKDNVHSVDDRVVTLEEKTGIEPQPLQHH